ARSQNDFVGGGVDQPSERLLRALRYAAETLGRHMVGGALPGNGFFGGGGGDARQRPLMRAVEPELAIEGAEVFSEITIHVFPFWSKAGYRTIRRAPPVSSCWQVLSAFSVPLAAPDEWIRNFYNLDEDRIPLLCHAAVDRFRYCPSPRRG